MSRLLTVTTVFALLLLPMPVSASLGFFVKPTRFEIAARPGETVTDTLRVLNKSAEESRTMSVKLVQLDQLTGGAIKILDDPAATPGVRNLGPALTIAESVVTIPSLTTLSVPFSVTMPRDARGTYLGGITVQNEVPEGQGIAIALRFLARIEVEVQGPIASSDIVAGTAALQTAELKAGPREFAIIPWRTAAMLLPRSPGR